MTIRESTSLSAWRRFDTQNKSQVCKQQNDREIIKKSFCITRPTSTVNPETLIMDIHLPPSVLLSLWLVTQTTHNRFSVFLKPGVVSHNAMLQAFLFTSLTLSFVLCLLLLELKRPWYLFTLSTSFCLLSSCCESWRSFACFSISKQRWWMTDSCVLRFFPPLQVSAGGKSGDWVSFHVLCDLLSSFTSFLLCWAPPPYLSRSLLRHPVSAVQCTWLLRV